MEVNGTINKRTDKEISMGRNDGRVVIFLYNLYMLFFYPLAIFMAITILSSMITGWILHKLFYHYFMIRTYAPITYYVENIMLVFGIIWTIVIEFNQNLREHLLLYPKEKRLVPNAEDETENRYWHGIWKVLFWSAVALMFLLILRIVE